MSVADPLAGTERVTAHGVEADLLRFPEGRWRFRLVPLRRQEEPQWRRGHATREAALADLEERARPLVLTRAEVASKVRHGYHSIVDGRPTVLRMCPLRGGTTLSTYTVCG